MLEFPARVAFNFYVHENAPALKSGLTQSGARSSALFIAEAA